MVRSEEPNNVYLLLGGLVNTACLISLTELQPFQGRVADLSLEGLRNSI